MPSSPKPAAHPAERELWCIKNKDTNLLTLAISDTPLKAWELVADALYDDPYLVHLAKTEHRHCKAVRIRISELPTRRKGKR